MEADGTGAAPLRRRRQQRSIDTRIRIINAALAEFARLGFAGASTRGIALAADVPHSLVLHHFGNKADLWRETVRETVGWYTGRVFLPEDDGAGPTERLRHYFAEYVRFSAEHPDFFRMITQENTLASDRLAWLVEQHSAANAAAVCALIAAAQAESRFVAGDPLRLLYMFLGAATAPYRSAAEMELVSGDAQGGPARVEEHVRDCERLFFREPPPSRRRGGGPG